MKEQEKAQTGGNQTLEEYRKRLDNKLGRNAIENVPASKEEKRKKEEEIERLRARIEKIMPRLKFLVMTVFRGALNKPGYPADHNLGVNRF